MDCSELLKELALILPENQIKQHEPLKNHTTFCVGGTADLFVLPNTIEQVKQIYALGRKTNTPVFYMGNGSNIIVRDGGIRGIVMRFEQLNEISVEGNFLRAQCGATLKDVTNFALDHGLSGLEFACGIPGSVGGALVMNAGAYGGQMQDVVSEVLVLNRGGELLTLTSKDLVWGYRKSTMMSEGYIVLEGVFLLEAGEKSEVKARMDDFTEQRQSKQPLEYPSAGSVFKRPVGYFAGKLIQDSGLQGVQIGGAQVSQKHAGFIVNAKDATAADVLALIAHVQDTVKKKFDVDLETEVRVVGEERE